MKIVILDALTYSDTSLEGFESLGDVAVYQTTFSDETTERVCDAEVIVTNKVVINDAVMESAPNLKLICVAATGTNNIDHEAAKRRGIAVKNVAGYSTDAVVQHTFSMLFYLMGHSRYYDEYVKSGAWQREAVFAHIGPSFSELRGKTWGIIGLGEIGRGVARVAQAFGANVCYYSTSGKNDNGEYEKTTLSRLIENSDVISIHAPLNASTENLISHSELLQMKDGAVLLNLGRGGIVDEDALSVIIDVKPIFVGLDVLAKEPMKTSHPLLSVKHPERLYITPHIAWTSREARERLIASTIENIKTFVKA
ncbi:D-isomer specific 2-hydroxyacid dehydrogenase NAD-binding protein [Sulfuricurvum kujiense DSM 16994]|uniref:D-isomer specific 2-hydroxyacid dehydrogenase NAD-binding protein n=1 Tax=Sulfuricurvum kujiense (strain ATCC BAA-921 / DSM 16994 / JCM 11577 / YK-1) TaxID=709032 RepID=E4TWR2_SULKY|nr:D-2-hydroxyacid dehydrogenase [Sulfuricurvum kujiense]ADR32743.1 D-isomer specific 2-hydroxyacid dehydrogenase NAD-binding protein [Sulfuricurvum kujiense DSM 16994]